MLDLVDVLISIHAPLTGSDLQSKKGGVIHEYFNPRSPYGERHGAFSSQMGASQFQSTLPLRGATCLFVGCGDSNFISIHAPLTGSDYIHFSVCRKMYISIHAPLTGSDFRANLIALACKYFNPRSPYGERPILYHIFFANQGFQSTLPLRGATVAAVCYNGYASISIHAPLTGSDASLDCGVNSQGISIHAPLTGSDLIRNTPATQALNFNPRSPYGERLWMATIGQIWP